MYSKVHPESYLANIAHSTWNSFYSSHEPSAKNNKNILLLKIDPKNHEEQFAFENGFKNIGSKDLIADCLDEKNKEAYSLKTHTATFDLNKKRYITTKQIKMAEFTTISGSFKKDNSYNFACQLAESFNDLLKKFEDIFQIKNIYCDLIICNQKNSAFIEYQCKLNPINIANIKVIQDEIIRPGKLRNQPLKFRDNEFTWFYLPSKNVLAVQFDIDLKKCYICDINRYREIIKKDFINTKNKINLEKNKVINLN